MNQGEAWEPLPTSSKHTYNHLRTRTAWESTRGFWNFHQSFSYLIPSAMGLVLAIALRYAYRGAGGLMDVATAELSALCAVASYPVCVVGSLIFNYIWTAPAELHAKRQKTIAEQAQTIAALSAKLEKATSPKRTLAEEHQFASAQKALQQIGKSGVVVLRQLHGVGSMTFGAMAPALPEGMTRDATLEILNACWQKYGLVVRDESRQGIRPNYTYKIAPGMQKALDELLFADTES
jgi:hypothetical protein